MGIRFECGHCGHTLHVKDYLAGKRGVCPHCQGKIDIPSGPTYQGPDEGGPVAVELRTAFDEQPTREMRPEDVQSFRAGARRLVGCPHPVAECSHDFERASGA